MPGIIFRYLFFKTVSPYVSNWHGTCLDQGGLELKEL